jgi:hypothetical protein
MSYRQEYSESSNQDDARRYQAANAMYYEAPYGAALRSSPEPGPFRYEYGQPPPLVPPVPPPQQPPVVPPPPPPKEDSSGRPSPIESPKEKKQNMIIRILRVIFILLQSAALIAGLGLVIAGSVWYREMRTRRLQGTSFGTLPMFAIGAGVALTLLSCIGLVSAITRGRSGAIVYSLLLLFLIGIQIYILWRAGRLEGRVMGFLSRKWDDMWDEQRDNVQQWRNCCGFGGVDDRAVLPCPKNAYSGCALPIHRTLKRWAGGMLKGLSIAVIVEIILIVLSLAISFYRPKH